MRELYKIRRLPHRFRPDMAVRSIPTKGQAELHRMPSHAPRQWELRIGWWILHRCSGSALPIDSRVARRKRPAAGRERQAQEGEGRGGRRSGNHYGLWRREFGHLSILQKQPVLRKGRDKAMLPGMARLEGGMSMERLTYDFFVGGSHCWQVKGADNLECREVCQIQGDKGCKDCPIAAAFDRLAAYEDTGFTPEEVQQMRIHHTSPGFTGRKLPVLFISCKIRGGKNDKR